MTSRGDEETFLAAIKAHEATIYKVCLTFADRHSEEARDLYQEIVCSLWDSWGQFKGGSSVRTWIYRVALYTAVSQLRRSNRRPVLRSLTPELAASVEDEADVSLFDELHRRIRRLNEEDQKLIYLYIDKLSLVEIGEIMHLSQANVGVRIHRIKKKLKEMDDDQEL